MKLPDIEEDFIFNKINKCYELYYNDPILNIYKILLQRLYIKTDSK